jgi:hypothetical protein
MQISGHVSTTYIVTPERIYMVSTNPLQRAANRKTYVWHGWQPSWCPRTRTQGRPRQLPEVPSRLRIGSAGQSAQQKCVVSTALTQRVRQPPTYLEVLRDLTNETLEWEFTDEEFRRLLVPANLTQSDGTRTEPMWLLNATSGCLVWQKSTIST